MGVKFNTRGTAMPRTKVPLIMIGSRILFAGLLVASFVLNWVRLPDTTLLTLPWIVYLVVIYGCAEYIYHVFLKRGIDLSYAFPLLFTIFLLNFVSELLNAQELMPDLNRAEHLTSFVFVAFIVWTFFTKYLPQDVWQEHPYYTSILVMAVVSMLGVGNEIIELFLDIMFNTRVVGPGFDTSFDLVMNTLGSGLFLSFRLIYETVNEKHGT